MASSNTSKSYHKLSFTSKPYPQTLKIIYIIIKLYFFVYLSTTQNSKMRFKKINKTIKIKVTRGFYENPIHSQIKKCLTPFSLTRLRAILSCRAQTYKIQYIRINNDIIKRDMPWHADHALRVTMTIIIDDFYMKCMQIYSFRLKFL